METLRAKALYDAIHRPSRTVQFTRGQQGNYLKVSDYFEENVFKFDKSKDISNKAKKELKEIIQKRLPLNYDLAKVVAKAAVNWATAKGATHFCHWFQPLTGTTAEKHDAFLDFDDELVIEKLSASQLIRGEPDASSFPHGGSRSTFEARGYTAWDITSPMFLVEGVNGKILYIPCGFVSYHGDALDQKTPLLRGLYPLSDAMTRFLHLTGTNDAQEVTVNIGAEQEYFLIDKAFYYQRPDLVMTGRTLFGELPAKNQQLEDHYFGSVEDRVLSFMQELEFELYRLGIPAKTRHNEVAPGQFELAPIFRSANLAADQNQLVMAYLKKVANRHNFVALLHEKPFAKINGSGKHLNWSLSDDKGHNLLSPGDNPHENYRFLGLLAIVFKAFHRHSDMIRLSIASQGNDHRLGGNEAPPSIMSIFIGDELNQIFASFLDNRAIKKEERPILDLKTKHLAQLLKDNTDRNRTSPFAFTGNKFEFRAVGSSAAVGFPICILNAAVADVVKEANQYLEEKLSKGVSVDLALQELIRDYYRESQTIIFNGDGYSKEWPIEAKERGLNNLRNSVDAFDVMKNPAKLEFLIRQNIFTEAELQSRHNIGLERYNKHIEIELKILKQMIDQSILPVCFQYKQQLLPLIQHQKDLGLQASVEIRILNHLNHNLELLNNHLQKLENQMGRWKEMDEEGLAHHLVSEALPLSQEIVGLCNQIESIIPNQLWTLPKCYEMLFVK